MIRKGIKITLITAAVFTLVSCSTINRLFGTGEDAVHDFDKGMRILSKSVIESLKSRNLYKVAVNDFVRIDDQNSVLGKAVSEELLTGFFSANAPFDLVERKQLEAALAEMNLNFSGLIDETQAAELGKLLGADALVIGSITPFVTYFKINARIFAVQDGRVAGAAAVKIKNTEELQSMYDNLLSSGQSTETGKPAMEEKKPVTSDYVQIIDDFTITLKEVARKGDKVWADFFVEYTGLKSEEWIGFYDARIIDESNNEFQPVGGGTLQPWDGWGGLDCVPGVPMLGNIPFEVGVAEVKNLALLEVEFRSRGKLYFKNIPVK